MSEVRFLLAGFQVTIIGRFWVTAEAWCPREYWFRFSLGHGRAI
jgi:hypothetical protein